jgi:predicted O-methyltransferase YrrM
MSHRLWSELDDYISEQLIGEDPVLDAALEASANAGLPDIAVSAPQGRLLTLLARIAGARNILEVGTLGGYSSICLARALPADGRLTTLELQASYAEVAAANAERAGLAGLIDFKVGRAIDSLNALIDEHGDPFDFVFVDADKASTPAYYQAALQLSRPGTVMVFDNVVRDGELGDPNTHDRGAQGMRRLHELLSGEPRVTATTIQTVGHKGYDGFTLVLVDPAS